MRNHPSTTTPTLARAVAELFGLSRPATVVHMPERRAPQSMTATLVALPSQMDLDEPVTTEARTALAMAAHALAAVVEKRTGTPTTAHDVYDDARKVLGAYLLTYRRVATSRDAAIADSACPKVD